MTCIRLIFSFLLLIAFGSATEVVRSVKAQAPTHTQRSDMRPLSDVNPDASSPLRRTVSVAAAPLERSLRMIASAAGLNIVFDTERVRREGIDGMAVDNVPAVDALLRLLSVTKLEAYVTEIGSVVIVPRDAAVETTTTQPLDQTMRGQVLDRATRTPLIGANAVVLETDPLLGASTDLEGRFVLENVPLGRHALRVSYIGYRPVVLPEIMVTAAREVVITVELEEQIFQGQEVIVVPDVRKDRPVNDMAMISARSFSVEETRRYAGGLDDPARMASSFAGVTTGAGIQENAVIVRGNAPKGVQWRLEGVEIPNPNHFAGLAVMGAGGLTLFSSELLATSDFLTSAFPAAYGNALAGVFDMRFRSGTAESRQHAFQVGLIGIDAASEGPFVRGKASTYLFNYRYSTIGLLMPLLPTEDVARFQDLSFKIHLPTKHAGNFEVWGIGGLDGQSAGASRDSSNWKYEQWDRIESDLSLGVGATGIGHTLILSPSTYLRTSLAATINRTVIDQQRMNDELVLLDNLAARNTSSRIILNSHIRHQYRPRLFQQTGVSVQRMLYDVHLRSAISREGPLVPIAIERGASTLVRGYTQLQASVAPSIDIQAGLHAQHFALTGRTSLEPRLGLQWDAAGGHVVTVGYGLHSQVEDLRIYLAEVGASRPNLDLGLARAHHGVVGVERRLSDFSRLRVEAYVQQLFDVPVIPDSSYSLVNFTQDWAFAHTLRNDGAGRNIGVEASLERFLHDGYYVLLTGSVFRSSYRGGDGQWRPTRWSRGGSLNVLAGREVQLGDHMLGINGRVSALGGLRRSPIDADASHREADVVLDASRAFAEREPGLILLDITCTYRRNHRNVSQIWALQVKNALAAKETVLRFNEQTGRVDEVLEGFPLPVLSYKVEF